MNKPHRDSIHVVNAEVLDHQHLDGEQHILRLQADDIARHAQAGSFVHLTCDPQLPMRRPFSIMRVAANKGWIELLYKSVGAGTALLARREIGEHLSVMGPIGHGFTVHENNSRPLLIGGGVGIPPMIFLADSLRGGDFQPFVIMGSEVPFPFTARPSTIMVPGMPDGVIACMPLLEDWGIAGRLASLQGYAGTHAGYVTDLARHWLDALDSDVRTQVEVFACGPHPMLEAVAILAREYDLPCQVSLEEFMACAVGGCAGCVVEVQTDDGPAMKRVCVDGPVFDAYDVFST